MGDNKQEDQQNNQNKRYGFGKRKREIKPITNKTTKQVTFSKRRCGLFKKASELCALCGTEVAVITFSNAGKLFTFGHPNADDIVYRFINFLNVGSVRDGNVDDNYTTCNVDGISKHYKEVRSNIDVEKKRMVEVGSSSSIGSTSREYSNTNNNNNFRYWWDAPIDNNMGLNELEQLKVALEGLRVEVSSRIDGINRSSLMNVLPQKFDIGSIDEWDFCC